ncbi:hypothetical protein MBH78_20945 [Oceanimonas sp. NS1]|nr:hypothetical protein [Oceanimonas sp. NS1]
MLLAVFLLALGGLWLVQHLYLKRPILGIRRRLQQVAKERDLPGACPSSARMSWVAW